MGLYSDAGTIGGAERSMFNLARAYSGSYELHVLSPSRLVLAEAERLVPHLRRHLVRARASGIASVVDHRRAYRAAELDLLHVNSSNPFSSRASIVGGWLARVPIVAVEHLVFPSRRRRGAILKRFVASRLERTIAVGHASADDLHRHFGIPASSLSVVHNGVPDLEVTPTMFARRPVIGCAARLEDQKGLDTLIACLDALPRVDLVIVGDGSRRVELERLADEREVSDRVHFVGWVDDARPYLAGLDIFVLPSRNESFPLTIIEAMLHSVPVVATRVGSVDEAVVEGVTGFLCDVDDPNALVEAIRRLLDDDDQRQRFGQVAREIAVERFTSDVMAANYHQIWSDVVRRDRARGRR